jgi:hypothetical protein
VVRHFQHFDGGHESVNGHPLLGEGLRVAGEHGIERAAPQVQDDAGVVRRSLGSQVGARPCHHDLGLTDAPAVSLFNRPHVETSPA